MPEQLPSGIRCQIVPNVNGLDMEVLEAGNAGSPCIVLLHGFPDLAYGWRHVMPMLANAGYHIIAPNQRGYGATGKVVEYDEDIRPYGMQNLSLDLITLLQKIGITNVHCLVGHDFGSPVAAYSSLFRNDLFKRLILMSAPFPGAPKPGLKPFDLDAGLSELTPPRKHYQAYNSGPTANADMLNCKQGLRDFLRAYFHMKSADWTDNNPLRLNTWSAEELAKMPSYYIMPAALTMPEVVAAHMPSTLCSWLNEDELDVFVETFTATGFQAAINWYRASSDPQLRNELSILHGKPIQMPCWYLAGEADWGTHQTPGALKRMQTHACGNFQEVLMVPNAGHWVQQEQPKITAEHILEVCSS